MSAKPGTPAPSAPGVHPKPFWSFRPRSDREAGDAVVSNFLLHWFPAKTYKPSLDWNYSFWLGTASAALFFLLVLSGLPLLLLYVPSVERAYGSVKDIEFVVTFGSWIRAVHRIAAHLMVAAVFLHLVRVFLTGAYKNGTGRGQRREWNWVLGVVMIVLTLFLSFTGLPPAVGPARLLGGHRRDEHRELGALRRPRDARAADRRANDRPADAHPLLRPARHLPAGRARGAPRVPHVAHPQGRRPREGRPLDADAGEEPRRPPAKTKTYSLLGVARGQAPAIRAVTLEAADRTVNSVNDLVRRISIVVLGTFAVVSIMACFIPSPLEEPANPMITPNPAKAPWYFLWLQEIVTDTTVKIGSFTINGAFLGGVILPTILLGLLAVWPWLDRSPAGAAGVWFHASRKRQNLVFLLVVLLVLAFTIVGTFLRGPYWNFYWPWQAWPELPTRI